MPDELMPWDEEYASSKKGLLQVSHAQPLSNGQFPSLPTSFAPTKMRGHLEQLAFTYLTTPGLIGEPLTPDDRANLTAAEVLIYEDLREAMAMDAPLNKRSFWLDRILPPVPKTIQSLNVTGDVKTWKEVLTDKAESLNQALEEAVKLEADRWKQEDVIDVEPSSG